MSLDFTFSDEELSAIEADNSNPYLVHPLQGMGLITRLIAQPEEPMPSRQRQHFQHLHDLIHQSYVSLSTRDTCPTEAANFRDLVTLEDTLEDLVTFPVLANKTVIGIGGGFSAGKSRFVNTLLGQDLLPEALEPTTAIPSYLVAGPHEAIRALNQFNHLVDLDRSALQAITHEFPRHYRQQHGVEIGFAHIVRLLMIHATSIPWQNLAFLDTPGYSKADLPQSAQADRQIALRQLREADHIIWLLNAKNGSIRRDDIEFLRDLNHEKPIFVVVTQADLVGSKSRINAILQSTVETLDQHHIACDGLMAWAAPMGKNKVEHWGGNDIHAWLSHLNDLPKETQTRLECARILDSHIQYNIKALSENKNLLGTLNELLPLTTGTEDARHANERDKARRLILKANEELNNLLKKNPGQEDDSPTSLFEIIAREKSKKRKAELDHQQATIDRKISDALSVLTELSNIFKKQPHTTSETKPTDLLRQHISELRQQQRQLKELIDDFGGLKEEMLHTITQLVGQVADDAEVQQGHTLIQFMNVDWFKRPPVEGETFEVRVIAIKAEEKKVVVVIGDDLAKTGIGFNRIWGGLRMDPNVLVKGSMLSAEVQLLDGDVVTLAIRNPFSEK